MISPPLLLSCLFGLLFFHLILFVHRSALWLLSVAPYLQHYLSLPVIVCPWSQQYQNPNKNSKELEHRYFLLLADPLSYCVWREGRLQLKYKANARHLHSFHRHRLFPVSDEGQIMFCIQKTETKKKKGSKADTYVTGLTCTILLTYHHRSRLFFFTKPVPCLSAWTIRKN